MSTPGITTVIVSRGLEPMLRDCLAHARRALGQGRSTMADRMVVVDNASQPAYTGLDAELLRFEQHQSFAAACNAGIQAARNDLYLMLNNDVFLHERAIGAMLEAMGKGARIGICGARLIYPDGRIQHAGIRFGPSELGPYHVHRAIPSAEVPRTMADFQAVTAACMLIRREAADELGGFDEIYPFGWEDVDLCLRARHRGWRVICCPDVDSIHFESLTPGRMDRDQASRDVFMARWKGRVCTDG